jgi:hypothetical protein
MIQISSLSQHDYAVHMMMVGPSVTTYRSSYQTTFQLLQLRVAVRSMKGKGIN